MRWAACAVVFLAFGGFGVSSAVGAVGVDVVFANPDYITFGVDPDGVGYGVLTDSSNPVQKYRLYRTLDEGRTWAPLHDFPTNSHVKGLSVLPSGTLLAHLVYDDEYLYRSSDGGQTWTPVLHYPLLYGVLTAHSVTSDGTYAYVVSYNNFSGDGPFTNWVWRSADDGQTWSIVYTTSAYRHGHAVQVNPYTGDVYVLWGDKEDVAAIERSTDHGQTWHKVCTTVLCVGVDIAFSPQGFAVFGRDSPFGPGAIQRLDLASGVSTTVASMAGTSFSAFRHQGVFLIGNTHEPQANYPANDPNLHLYASADEGLTFNDVFQIPWQYPNGYIELRVQYAYPSGDFPIQVTGYGTIVAKLTGVGSSPSVPANTALPAVSGTAQVGQTLSGSTGSWSNSPTSYARQWTRCNSSGSSCVDINGATAASYLLVAADQGSTIRVRVTASNAAGPGAPATSAQTAVVAAAGGGGGGGSFGATAAGSLSGAPGSGYKFGSAYPLAAAATATTFEFYARGGSTARSFTPAIYTSTGSAPGTLVATGQTVTVAANQPAGWVSSTLPPTPLPAGSYYLVLVSGPADNQASIYYNTATPTDGVYNTNPAGTPTPTFGSPDTEPRKWSYRIQLTGGTPPTPPTNTTPPTISGTTVQGQTLTATNGTWSGNPTSYTHQWRRCNTSGTACTDITTATTPTYTLQAADTGSTLRIRVTATNTAGPSTPTDSTQTTIVTAPPPAVPANTALPAVSGTAQVGQTLSGSSRELVEQPHLVCAAVDTLQQQRQQLCRYQRGNCSVVSARRSRPGIHDPSAGNSLQRSRARCTGNERPDRRRGGCRRRRGRRLVRGDRGGQPVGGAGIGLQVRLRLPTGSSRDRDHLRVLRPRRQHRPIIHTRHLHLHRVHARHPRRDRTNRHRGRKPTSRLGQLHPPPDPPPGRQLLPRPRLRPRRQPSLHLLQHRHPNRRRLQHQPRRHPHPNLRQPRHRTTQMELPDPH